MTDSCATCRWARRAPPRVREDRERADFGMWDWASKGSPPDFYAERSRCIRFPQAVENDATYWCGEYATKDKEAA